MSRRSIEILVPTAIVVVAGLTRLLLLDQPDQIVFDETYYVTDARSHLAHGAEEGFAVHPPVGKWLIAAGIALVGDTPVGWRITAAVVGTLVVLLTYLIARRLLPAVGAAALAGLLAAFDGLLVVQSRIAMLDVFLALFVVLGAWLLLIARDRGGPWWALPGVALGLAVATKWSGILAVGAAGLAVLGWAIADRRSRNGGLGRARPLLGATALALVVVPAAVYLVTWVPWLVGFAQTHEGEQTCTVDGELLDPCEPGVDERVAGLARHHVAIWRFHRDLEADHPYMSHAVTWPVLARPIVYHFENCPDDPAPDADCAVAPGEAREIVALGNPALWWGALLALVALGWGLVRRDRRAAFIAVFWAGQYVPWLLVDRPLFLFYMTPVVPFMAVAVAYALTFVDERRARGPGAARRGRATPGTITAMVIAVAAGALFVYFYPVLVGLELPEEVIRQRWWFDAWI